MDAKDLILVSVDDHLVEPPSLFEGRMAARYVEAAPKIRRTADGSDVWVFNDVVIPNVGLNAVAGRPKEEYGVEPTAFDEMRPGCYDVHERIKDMNAGGVLGSMNFPSFPGFSGRLFAACEDKGLVAADEAGACPAGMCISTDLTAALTCCDACPGATDAGSDGAADGGVEGGTETGAGDGGSD